MCINRYNHAEYQQNTHTVLIQSNQHFYLPCPHLTAGKNVQNSILVRTKARHRIVTSIMQWLLRKCKTHQSSMSLFKSYKIFLCLVGIGCLPMDLDWLQIRAYLKYFKSSYVQDSNKWCTLSFGSVKWSVDSGYQPSKHSFIQCFWYGFHSKFNLVQTKCRFFHKDKFSLWMIHSKTSLNWQAARLN